MSAKNCFLICCMLGWYTTSLAAQSQVDTLTTLPWASISISAAISVWGGLISTLQKLNSISEQSKSLKIEVFKDLLASIAAGFIAYAFGMWSNWNVWLLAIMLLIAGYGGSKVLDAVLNLTIKKIESTDVSH